MLALWPYLVVACKIKWYADRVVGGFNDILHVATCKCCIFIWAT